MSQRVMVAMSGGVDSAVAACRLRDQGYEVVGATLRLLEGGSRCCSIGDIDDARRTCETLGVRHYVLDARDAFHTAVIQRFLDQTTAGLTPSPCVGCNSRIKFGFLLEQALALGCERLATGHYAQIVTKDGRHAIRVGRDPRKDQSYFLWELSQAQLAHTLFPVGELVKEQARALAAERHLLPAAKPESMDLCFFPKGGRADYVKEHLPELTRTGKILSTSGKVLGEHQGAHLYTVGQRQGLGLTLHGGPWYVISTHMARNEVVIGRQDEACAPGLTLHGLKWMWPPAAGRVDCQVRIRYNQHPVDATVVVTGEGTATVTFAAPQFAVTAGQATVFYDGEIVLGGGWIAAALPSVATPVPAPALEAAR